MHIHKGLVYENTGRYFYVEAELEITEGGLLFHRYYERNKAW